MRDSPIATLGGKVKKRLAILYWITVDPVRSVSWWSNELLIRWL